MTPSPARLSAHELIDLLTDEDSFVSWDSTPVEVTTTEKYAAELAAARERSGVDESVLTGEGLIRGRRVAIIVSEFAFLAGSIGVAAAQRLVEAIEKATLEGLPLLAGPASGGTRMQEGTLAFLSMVKISAALSKHKAAKLPYLVYLRHPTTGGVMASWASLGHVTVAEPGALVGFLGPRVFEAIYGEKFPEGVQVSENLYSNGLIDGVIPPRKLPGIISRILRVLDAPVAKTPPPQPEPWTGRETDTWESIVRSRDPERPGIRALLRQGAHNVLPLNGTGQGEKDPGLVLALAQFGRVSCVVMGQDRQAQRVREPMGPAALREARRGMRLAEELGLPLVTVIDTPGAALSQKAEEGGLAGEIARCLLELVTLPSPSISLILGEGTGGGALALLPADRTLAAENAWLSPLPPEGASAIVYRDTEHAAQMAQEQGVSSFALRESGIVDWVIPERPDAVQEPEAFCARVAESLEFHLWQLRGQSSEARLSVRFDRYRRLGLSSTRHG
ncbi:carboxyl transferase domain-containing protein [Lysinibacter sp. HNR]|uniref:carboxyl transferase domain-containing protein n=1 Tax=Lysinibacter sp. HNR TaxID=3031408 RepID=UPI0024351E14|nr:carboxyl transferase domain-containing protein [Lysinibacter sp. HNR]WGD37810.1 carboxyl transferase domain-containing protein [Lysinibacter sp. HNR]